MPTHSQGTVKPAVTEFSLGKTGANNIASIFEGSPIHAGEMTESSVKEQYQNEVLDAEINDGGHTFGTYNTSYADAPDLADVETGGGGLPAGPYVPNPMSPGEGSDNWKDQPAAPGGWAESQQTSAPFVGVGHALSPKVSSEKMSGATLGSYIRGKSPASVE
jgi:hypothetical protein